MLLTGLSPWQPLQSLWRDPHGSHGSTVLVVLILSLVFASWSGIAHRLMTYQMRLLALSEVLVSKGTENSFLTTKALRLNSACSSECYFVLQVNQQSDFIKEIHSEKQTTYLCLKASLVLGCKVARV